MNTMYSVMQPHLRCFNLWQVCPLANLTNLNFLNKFHITHCESKFQFPCLSIYLSNLVHELKLDGRPMSGDIGRGATRESLAFAVQLAAVKDRPPGLYTIFLSC